ncbi:MAG: 3-deoxy-manno-octulosonate cytidylyltransferase [Verrucomicrobiae bacterium]|nr:3-deoxy-manno-octulosonate cytidylyltransferase [Verrucomicrobiae bacterium]MCB1236717.1 3-deoxy-manno-octulosonate cytidylyltransferase [Verrucomicrobiae bacterium]MCP5541512.1 3-deoxy-manno-octulosonate cytidylyltransferase [Akkermansiaceae bacterium]MCP5551462.1 3-deoxy-manno-octulosonate cytidylyltransferase [Akkermansiaceae bacterium]
MLGVIPARWGSTRFPGKPLHPIAGKPLIQHVWERCRACRKLDAVAVATDDERIARAVRAFGGEVVMTRSDHESGTDRIAEVARKRASFTHIVNIQGDEPLISPKLIDRLADRLVKSADCPMITAANEMAADDPDFDNPNVVKVTIDRRGRALYFSRSLIPYPRNPETAGLRHFRHKGIYGFRRDFLLQFVRWKPSMLERAEGLEQLRAMENGAEILVILTDDDSPGVDTPEQAAILHDRLLSQVK